MLLVKPLVFVFSMLLGDEIFKETYYKNFEFQRTCIPRVQFIANDYVQQKFVLNVLEITEPLNIQVFLL